MVVDMQPIPSRVLRHFVCNSEIDTPDNRKRAEDALREKGATSFRHVTEYSAFKDITLLQTHGYVMESDCSYCNGTNTERRGDEIFPCRHFAAEDA